MSPELQAYLDGELAFDDLPIELRDEALAWREALGEDGSVPRNDGAPQWLEDAVMAQVALEAESLPRAERRAGLVGWLTRPRTVRISPLAGGLAAAAMASLMFLPFGGGDEGSQVAEATIYVQFVMEAPSARSVAVAGDFNDWEAEHQLSDPDGDGVWTGRVAVEPGIHEYMFVVDGAEWITPPGAEGYRDDGFGSRNAVVTVLPTA